MVIEIKNQFDESQTLVFVCDFVFVGRNFFLFE